MRRLVLTLVALAALAVSASAQSGYQLPLQFVSYGDTAIGALPGKSFVITVQTAYDNSGLGLDSFALRFPFDSSRLTFVSAAKRCPDTTAALNAAALGGVLTVSTAKCSAVFGGQPVFELTFQFSGAATDGTWLSMVPLALIDNGLNNRLADAATDVVQICHALGLWGDVSGDGVVNSLDALITLSGAVGLPTAPYSLANADVDADGQVTSRDALIMLSAGIGLPTTGFRVNRGVVDRCAPQITLPRPLYFSRSGIDPGVAGVSGLAIRTANDSSVIVAGDSSDVSLTNQWRPRVSPDGSHILFVCDNPYSYYPGICKANADGSSRVHLTPAFNTDVSPDWSPDGSRIVFVRSGGIYVMDSAGASPVLAAGSPPTGGVTSVAWRPMAGSSRVAYTINVCCTAYSGEIHTTNVDTAASDAPVHQFVCCAAYNPRWIDWTLAGDSLVFDYTLNGYSAVGTMLATVGAAPPPAVPLAALSLRAAQHPLWTSLGVLFDAPLTTSRLLLRRPDGSIVQVRPDKVDNFLPGMQRQ